MRCHSVDNDHYLGHTRYRDPAGHRGHSVRQPDMVIMGVIFGIKIEHDIITGHGIARRGGGGGLSGLPAAYTPTVSHAAATAAVSAEPAP